MPAARITARFRGSCNTCGAPVAKGDRILLENKRVVGCQDCCYEQLREAKQEVALTNPIRMRVVHIAAQRDDWASLKVLPLEKLPEDAPAIEGLIPIVGEGLAAFRPGDYIDAAGTWKHDARFGWQLRVVDAAKAIDASVESLVEFLSQIPAIGTALAERLAQTMPPAAILQALAGKTPGAFLNVLDDAGQRIVSDAHLEAIFAAYEERRDLRSTWQWLKELHLDEWLTKRILQVFKGAAKRLLQEDPYCLVPVEDLGFEKADAVARKMNIAQNDPRRLKAAVLHVLLAASEDGHLWCDVRTIQGIGDKHDAGVRAARDTGLLQAELSEGLRLALADHDGAIFEKDGRVYARRLYVAEQKVAASLWRLYSSAQALTINEAFATKLAPGGVYGSLHELQRRAVTVLAEKGIVLLTGGPGTGKTTTTCALLDLLAANGRRIAGCAPTGKAAIRLAAQTGRSASTIHRLLAFDPKEGDFTYNSANPLPFDAIVVDEASMVDVELAASLFSAIKSGAALIIVGDSDQLPSVGPGAVLRDLIAAGCLPHVELTHIFRQAAQSRIPHLARSINEGALPASIAGVDVVFIPIEDPNIIQPTIVEIVSNTIPKSPLGTSVRVTDAAEIQVIAAQHDGAIGVKRLNALLQDRLNFGDGGVPIGGEGLARVDDRVIQTRNDYDLGVLNGEIGTVLFADPEGTGAVTALMTDEQVKRWQPSDAVRSSKRGPALVVDYGDRIVGYLKGGTRRVQLAYCCTVHKAQGSQFPAVVVPVHADHSFMLTRSLVYTAVTRAERLLVMVGQADALYRAIGNLRGQTRRTSLKDHLDAVAAAPAPVDVRAEARASWESWTEADVRQELRIAATLQLSAPTPVLTTEGWKVPFCQIPSPTGGVELDDRGGRVCGRPGITVENELTVCATHWSGGNAAGGADAAGGVR